MAVLTDLRDRMLRAVDSAAGLLAEVRELRGAGGVRGWIRRLWHPDAGRILEAVAALEAGCRLSLRRIEGALEEAGVVEIEAVGLAFDPHRMLAVDVEESDVSPEGTVLEVYRPGYEWHDDVLRPAEVKVARTAEPEEW